MSAQVYNLREIRAKRAIEHAHRELEKHMEEIAKIPYRGQGIDGMTLGCCGPVESATISASDLPFLAPSKDPA